ncbi:MAG: hypothetical protein J6S14_00345 [Clostridia bacterium]|nr:hypothetical protein [Clostridia bacterium]
MNYLDILIEQISKQRQESINNFEKTDLYTKDDLCKILKWYDRLLLLIKKTPPSKQVSKIKFKENESGEIIAITYVYGEKSFLEFELEK